MSGLKFQLDSYRFKHIEANAISSEPDENQMIEVRFEIGINDDNFSSGNFTVGLKLFLSAIKKDQEREDLLLSEAQGEYSFIEGIDPYEITNDLERLLASTMLYSALRPTLDSIVGNIGLRGLTMPLNLPLGKDGKLPNMSEKEN